MSHRLISTILRHDQKQNSYKIALLRSLNDVVLSFPGLEHGRRPVAVPLKVLAEFWVAYYWPFVDPDAPIFQGVRSRLGEGLRQDVSFRTHLTELRRAWRRLYGPDSPADGFHLINEMRVHRRQSTYSEAFRRQYGNTLTQISRAIRKPVQYAGPGEWQVFSRPRRLSELPGSVAIPGLSPSDVCILVDPDLWAAFRDVSLWVEALCIHEWCLLSERMGGEGVDRGSVYRLLTVRPGNRLPLDWERNEIDLLMMEGARFECPWTGRHLAAREYHLDHIVPVTVYPFNEMWNLVPADPRFNMHGKRGRLPSESSLASASPRLARTYGNYHSSTELAAYLSQDVATRFGSSGDTPEQIVRAVGNLVMQIYAARNLPTF